MAKSLRASELVGPSVRAALLTVSMLVAAAVLARILALSVDQAPVDLLAGMLALWTPSGAVTDVVYFATWSGIPLLAALALVAFRCSGLQRSFAYSLTATCIWGGALFLVALQSSRPPWFALASTLPVILLAGVVPLPAVRLSPRTSWWVDGLSGVTGALMATLVLGVAVCAVPVAAQIARAGALEIALSLPYTIVSVVAAVATVFVGGELLISDGVTTQGISVWALTDSGVAATAVPVLGGVLFSLLITSGRVFMYRTRDKSPQGREALSLLAECVAAFIAYVVMSQAQVNSPFWQLRSVAIPLWAPGATIAMLFVLFAWRYWRAESREKAQLTSLELDRAAS